MEEINFLVKLLPFFTGGKFIELGILQIRKRILLNWIRTEGENVPNIFGVASKCIG